MGDDNKHIRILLAKPGLDGHDRGIRLVARVLRDAAFEVVFLGLRVTPEQIVQSAVQEDVDLIGLSVFSGGHMTLVPRILHALREGGVSAVPVVVGGIIPPSDALELKRIGVSLVFGPGGSTSEIISSLRRLVSKHDGSGGKNPHT
jgi:methylmalonyl-CoA mutase C-terminal domain/subunit